LLDIGLRRLATQGSGEVLAAAFQQRIDVFVVDLTAVGVGGVCKEAGRQKEWGGRADRMTDRNASNQSEGVGRWEDGSGREHD
jgi:hypothetical protein